MDWWKRLESKYKILFCFLIFLRLFLASVTAHPDAWALFITLMFEASLSYGLFVPLKSSLAKAQSLSVFVSRFTDVYQFKSLLRSVFAGTAIFYSFMIFKNKNNV